MDGIIYRRIFVFSVIFFNISFICCFSLSNNCSKTFTENGILSFNSSDYNETNISFCVVGPIGSHVSFVLLARDVFVDENSTLEIDEMIGNFTDILVVTNGTNITEDIYANSVANEIVITFSTQNNSTEQNCFRITFQIESEGNMTTIYTNPSDVIASNGSYDKGVNYIHTYLIYVNQGNRIYLFLIDLLLNDQTGDFLVIGSGNDVLSGPPSVLMTGSHNKFNIIIVESNRAYLHLYAKNYIEPWHFSFYYNTSLVISPTDEPPTTEAPPTPLNATINYDVAKENFTAVVIKFAQTIQHYGTSYCRGEFFKNGTVSNVTLNVTVVEAAITDPCLVLVFYVLLSGSDTCVGHRPFLVGDFQYMMENYGLQIEDMFGRTVMSSCGMDITVWVLVVAIVACISLTLTIIMAMTSRNDKYNKLAKPPKNANYDDNVYKKLPKNGATDSILSVENNIRLNKTRNASYDSVAFKKEESFDYRPNSEFILRIKKGFVNDFDSEEEIHYEKRPAIMRLKSFEDDDEDEIFTTRKLSKRGESLSASDKSAISSSSSNYPSSKSSTRRSTTRSTEIENHIYYEVNGEHEPVFTFENTMEETKL